MNPFTEVNQEQLSEISSLLESFSPVQAEFNVGLYVGSADDAGNDHASQQKRYNTALRILQRDGREVHDRFSAPKTKDDEPTLVAKGIFDGEEAAKKAGAEIAKETDQIAVAVWFPTLNKGFLVGDRAHEWGDFNPEYFQRY